MNRSRPVAATLACAMVLTACGASTSAPSASATFAATPSYSPTATSTSTPSDEPASPSQSLAPITSWRMTASFDSDPLTSYVTDVAAWTGGFVAIGSTRASDHSVGLEMPAVWTSVDGESWEEQPVELGVDDVSLIGIAPRTDGRLLLVGNLLVTNASPERVVPKSVAWVSEDGRTWEVVDSPVDAAVDSFDHGPMGYVLTTDGEIWFSADGTDWTMTYDGGVGVVAGSEGFVAMVVPEAAGPTSVVASADGLSWFESGLIASPLLDVAAIGGDWVASGYSGDPTSITLWHSANGLDWTAGADVNDLTGPDGPKTGRGLEYDNISDVSLAGGAGYAFLTLTNNHCCAQMPWNHGAWGSADGMTWTAVVAGDAFVRSVASNSDTTVLAGHLGRGNDAAFWVGDR